MFYDPLRFVPRCVWSMWWWFPALTVRRGTLILRVTVCHNQQRSAYMRNCINAIVCQLCWHFKLAPSTVMCDVDICIRVVRCWATDQHPCALRPVCWRLVEHQELLGVPLAFGPPDRGRFGASAALRRHGYGATATRRTSRRKRGGSGMGYDIVQLVQLLLCGNI